MAAKEIKFDTEAREAIRRGVHKLAKAVRTTLGPSGRVVILEKSFGSPTVTKDGVTVAKEIEVEDTFENIGAQMVKEVASKSSKDAGDGTTTATIYAETIFTEGLKNITAGANANQVKRGIDKAVDAIVKELRKLSKDISSSEEIAQVGTCSANQDEQIGKIIAEAMDKVGKDGVITVEESKSFDTTIDVVEGMQFDRGYLSPYFVTNQDEVRVELDKPLVLATTTADDFAAAVHPRLERRIVGPDELAGPPAGLAVAHPRDAAIGAERARRGRCGLRNDHVNCSEIRRSSSPWPGSKRMRCDTEGSDRMSTATTSRTDTPSASAMTGRFSGSCTSKRTRADFGNRAPRQRLGRKAATAVSASTSDPMGMIGPWAE